MQFLDDCMARTKGGGGKQQIAFFFFGVMAFIKPTEVLKSSLSLMDKCSSCGKGQRRGSVKKRINRQKRNEATHNKVAKHGVFPMLCGRGAR